MALNRDQIFQLRQDLSQFLIHLTRTGPVTFRKDIFPQLTQDTTFHRTAKQRLEQLLTGKKILAISPFGYFHYKVPITYSNGHTTNPNSNVKRDWLKAACFTETPLDHIHIQTQPIMGRNLNFEPYGLAFSEGFLKRHHATPVMYFEADNLAVKKSLDQMAVSQDAAKLKSLMPFYESFGPRIYGTGADVDFRWEREWRVTNHVSFDWSDVSFGLCRESDIPHFSNLVGNTFPFIEPPSTPQQSQQVKQYLRTFPKLANLK
jgi:hypothetical protein